jgi:hypothetical protein
MRNIREHNTSYTAATIGTGRNRRFRLLTSGSPDLFWLQEKIPALLDRKDGQPVKSSPFSTVLRFQDPDTGKGYFFKEYLDRGVKDRLRKMFRSTRSRKAFRAGHILLDRGFLTPVPLIQGFEKGCCFVRRNFLITGEVPGERTYQYFQSRFPLPLSAEMLTEKRALISAAGHEIGRMHRMGVFHGDLRVGNIIIDGRGASAQFFFIDNERTQFYQVLPGRKRLKNLVQLNMVLLPHITKADRLRFLNMYLTENPDLLPEKKTLIREILIKTGKRYEKKTSG